MTIYLPRTLTHAVACLLGACVALLVALSLCALSPTTASMAPTTSTTVPCSTDGQCCAFWAADALNIHFTVEDGATEELDSFSSLSAWCREHKATALFNN